ncbi:MAG: TlpA family protein disulfide reductase [Acidobacteria bacterium]|nr:TlpA family protein disulfide reductase [Acidobacteriota bacterium]MYD69651.1 TlpA family protein disulfide reductase [Acidobacteriota bacterium]MYJ03527.1 TlpA family protein disulfide reductase [Acidobacteriota bacterium]
MSDLPGAGATAPPFTLNDAAGATHVFSASNPDAAPATLLFFFKHDCATCDLTAPVVERVQRGLSTAGLRLIGVSQDDPRLTRNFAERHGLTFPCALDSDLAVSEAYGFDAVPALVLAGADGAVLASSEGWSKAEFTDLAARAAERCDIDPPAIEPPDAAPLPAMRPGCGSRVHDPDVARRLAARRGGKALAARRVRVPSGLDVFEFLDEQGLTDGLPVVPPTEERVARMLEGTTRGPGDIVADVPPNLVPATVEKIAVNAVMAGCRPDYLPVVIAAVEAACTDAFNLHGVLATTYFVGPMIIVNGPIRHRIGLNSGRNVFGQGSRANATIGRALQLVVRNVGGGRPGEVDMSTLGQPGKFTACIAENEERSCWEPLHVERGFDRDQSTVTVFAAEAPRAIRDQLSRNARSLATSMGMSMEAIAHLKLHRMDQALLVVSPEHVTTFERDGYSKQQLRERIQEVTSRPLRELLPTDECQKGMIPRNIPKDWLDEDGRPLPEALDNPLPKFLSPDHILIAVAGGTAGKFSAAVGGWASGGLGSRAVTVAIRE